MNVTQSMREILFRGQKMCPKWHADYREWHYGDLATESDFPRIYTDSGICNEVFPETVGQYTGLCDKNGVRIFEGDIIRFADDDGDPQDGAVFWDAEHSGFSVKWEIEDQGADEYAVNALEPFDAEHSEVIGNIYDYSELPKTKEVANENH